MNAVLAWLRRPAVLKAGRISGYVVFGLATFLISVVLTFPSGRLRTFLEGRLSAPGRVVRIESARLSGLGSLVLTGVKVELPAEATPANPGGVAPPPAERRSISFDRVEASVGLFRLLLGDLSMELLARAGDGVLGPVHVLKTKEKLSIDVREVKDYPLPSDMPVFGMRLSGVLNGKAELVYDLKDGLAGSTGRVDVSATKVRALKPTLRSEQHGSVTLTDVEIGRVRFVVNLDKRSNLPAFKSERRAPGGDATVIQFEKAEVDGADVKALVEEHSVIRMMAGKPLGDGQMNVEAAFSLSDGFFDRSVTVGGESQTPNRFLRTLLGMDPRWKAAQAGGYWGVVCTGTLSRPSCMPKRPAIRGGDFKAPAKEEDRGERPEKDGGKGAPAAPAAPARVAPAAPSAPSYVPPPAPAPIAPPSRAQPPSPAPEEPSNEPAPAPAQPAVPPPSVMNNARPVVPTVIGRPRVRLPATEEPAEGAPSPSPGGEGGEGAGTVAPPGQEQE